MATRTYEIKGKYTDGTDYTAGTFTVSDGTNGTNGTNGKDALVYLNVIQTAAPTVGAMKVLVSTDFNRTPVINDEFIGVCQYETNKSFIAVWRVQLVSGENVTCNIVNYVITTGATGQKGADGSNGTNGKDGADGVGFYYTTDASTGTSGISTLLSNIMPSGIKVDDFLVNANGKVCQVTEISGTNVSAQYRTSIKGATGATGSPGATGKGIASVQVVEV
jgi:GXT repeat-containing collagen-like protein